MRRRRAAVGNRLLLDPEMGNQSPQVIAAVDLGSNSFHMIVGELRHGQLTIIDRLRETVRLSEGLQKKGALDAAARNRALACLSRFGERLKDMQAANVRAAGTSALRRARDSRTFLQQAEEALGHPIDVIAGIEEARLIYSGVVHSMPPNDGLRLVLDIGGGSTELILGQGDKPEALESLTMGCVVMTETHFPAGKISRQAFEAAKVAVRLKLRPIKAYFRDGSNIEAIGASGTIRATEAVARELGLLDDNQLTISVVENLIDRVCGFANASDIDLAGLSHRRAQVWPGGLAILVEVMLALRIDGLSVSDGALREGLLYEYSGRLLHKDARDRSVAAMARRYHVDLVQAARVAETAADLFEELADEWNIRTPAATNLLGWAAQLHEIGLDIAHDAFQKHGAYVVGNADMPGFPRDEQAILAYMIHNQRGTLKVELGDEQPAFRRIAVLRLTIVLRLAVLLNRSRSPQKLPAIRGSASDAVLVLRFPADWLQSNPLSVADLERENYYLRKVDYELRIELTD